MFKNKIKFKLILTALFLFIPFICSCTIPAYRTYTLRHYDYKFSFEYPSGYKKIQSYIQNNPDAPLAVRFALEGKDPVLGVSINSPRSINQQDPAIAANTSGGHSPDQELERSSILIAGENGEMVVYSSFTDSTQNTPLIVRDLFFRYNGTLWSVFIYSSPDKADEARLDFEHIIQTFKLGENN